MLRGEPLPKPRAPWQTPALVIAAIGAVVAWRAITAREDVPPPPAPPMTSAIASAPAAPPPPRCAEVSTSPFVIGDAPRPAPAPSAEPNGRLPDDPPEEHDDIPLPFAVEVGRGAIFGGGFAVGARREGSGKEGTIALVATMRADGSDPKLVRLGRLRGDLDPPVVAGAGDAVLAVMVEPNAGNPALGGGRSLRVAKVRGEAVTWGPELPGDHDESQAIDVAASAERALVVWDDIAGTAKQSAVYLSTVDVAAMKVVLTARAITASGTDAERPRLAARPGGYWLAYVVRGTASTGKKGEKSKRPRADEEDDRELGEAITSSWIEVMPLDESGAPASAARAVTPKAGHVLSYDLESGEDGGALVVWRDDDTPTGSAGGRLLSTLARLGGGGEPRLLSEESAAAGVPDLFPGWIAVAGVSGATRLAALSPRGELLEDLAPEKPLGAGVPIAAARDAILWARPMGQAMRLSVVRCTPRPLEARDAGAGPRPGPAGSARPPADEGR